MKFTTCRLDRLHRCTKGICCLSSLRVLGNQWPWRRSTSWGLLAIVWSANTSIWLQFAEDRSLRLQRLPGELENAFPIAGQTEFGTLQLSWREWRRSRLGLCRRGSQGRLLSEANTGIFSDYLILPGSLCSLTTPPTVWFSQCEALDPSRMLSLI